MQYVNGDLKSAWQGVKSMAAINHCDRGRNQLITVIGWMMTVYLTLLILSFHGLKGLNSTKISPS